MKNIHLLILIAILGFSLIYSHKIYLPVHMLDDVVHAEDEREDDDRPRSSPTPTPAPTPTPELSKEPVKVQKLDPAYSTDTDKDGLVDAIDPHPTVPEQAYFTDSDGDGVADAYDKYPGQDDFLFVNDTDANNNGVLDSYE